jgi:hypothetical protein
MPDSTLSAPLRPDALALADWIELTMIIEDADTWSTTMIRSRLNETLGADDAAISLATAEMARRARVMPRIYPFVFENSIVKMEERKWSAYFFLLVLSMKYAPFRVAEQWSDATRQFESLCALAFQNFFGRNTQTLRFGASPVDGDRPPNLLEALNWLSRKTGIALGVAHPNTTSGDGGLDVIGWKRYEDDWPAFPVVLVQCTVQLRFGSKGSDISADTWRSWLRLGVDPTLALAVPFATRGEWGQAEWQVNVVVDRNRLCEMLSDADLDDWPMWSDLHEWSCEQVRPFIDE